MPSHFDHELLSTKSQPSFDPTLQPATADWVIACQAKYEAMPNASHASTRSVQRTGALNAGAHAEPYEPESAPLCLACGTNGTNEDITSIYVVVWLAASAWPRTLAGRSELRPSV